MSFVTYQSKPTDYFIHARREIEPLLVRPFARCLEVGCGAGHTGAWMKSRHCESVIGIELFPSAAEQAAEVLDNVICADVEAMDVSVLPRCDLLLCLDVLEHLRDPWATLAKLRTVLNPDGVLITSIPNVRHASVSLNLLLRGKWTYTDDGYLDRTHMRFFTKETAMQLVKGAGFRIDEVVANRQGSSRLAHRLTLGLFPNLFAMQYLIRGINS